MKIKERISAVLLLCVFGFAFLYSGQFPEVPQIMPRLVSGAGMILCAALLIRTFVVAYPEEDAKASGMDRQAMTLLGLSIVLLAAYVLLIRVIGYYVTSFLFLIALSFAIDRTRKWWQYLTVAAGILILIWLVFDRFLSIPLPKGLLF